MLLERDEQLSSLRARIDAAGAGSGAIVLLAGEAGSGKTSLARALIGQIEGTALTIQGWCDPLSTPRPLSPIYDFAADPNAGLDELPLGEAENIDVFRAVLERLRHSIRPILLIVEDIHWADQATLDFIKFIGRRIADSKGVVVCTYRDDEVGPEHPLRAVLGQLVPLDWTHRISVQPLTQAAVGVLAEASGLDPARLHSITAGNAFFVTELIAAGGDLPATVEDAVLARLARLDPGPREVAQAVSIAPRALEVDRAVLLTGGAVEDIDRAVASGVLLGDGGSLLYRHDLARSAVEQSIPPARRYDLHRRMLSLLLEEDPPDHARLAHHAVQADSAELVARYAPIAADEAARRGARKEAIEFYRAALDHSEHLDLEDAASISSKLGLELGRVDRQVESAAVLEHAVELHRQIGDPAQLASALIRLSRAHWRISDLEGAGAIDREARELLEPLGPTPQLADAHFMAAYRHMLAREGSSAARQVSRARAIAEQVGDAQALWNIRMMEGTVQIVLGNARRGLAILEESRQAAVESGDLHAESIAIGMLGSGGGEARLYEPAIAALEAGVRQGLDTDEDYAVAYNRSWLARIAFEQGRWDDAVAHAELVDRTVEHRTGISVLTALSALGRVRVRRGDPGGIELLDEMIEVGADHELQHVWNAICGRAEHCWLVGRPATAWDTLTPAYERALATESEWAQGEIGYWMWKTGAIEQPPVGAAEPFALQMSGEWRRAASVWREIGCPYEVALSLFESGEPDSLLEAVEIFDSLGAKPMGDRVRAELRDLGVGSIPRGPARSTRANPAGMTKRQVEVLELVARGLSNADIAEKLFISKKTVEHHVSAIFTKLGVNSRREAVDAYAKLS